MSIAIFLTSAEMGQFCVKDVKIVEMWKRDAGDFDNTPCAQNTH